MKSHLYILVLMKNERDVKDYLWFRKMEKVVKKTFKANNDDIGHIIDQIKGGIVNRACDSLNEELILIR